MRIIIVISIYSEFETWYCYFLPSNRSRCAFNTLTSRKKQLYFWRKKVFFLTILLEIFVKITTVTSKFRNTFRAAQFTGNNIL